MKNSYTWNELKDKKVKLPHKVGTFIAISREISDNRIKQIVKEYLPKGNIVWGITSDTHVAGFEGQPQFRLIKRDVLEAWAEKVNSRSPNKLILLEYDQDQAERVVSKVKANSYVFVRGSWLDLFHRTPVYHKLTKKKRSYELISPFTDEQEARIYAEQTKVLHPKGLKKLKTIEDFMEATRQVAKVSYDYAFQVGAVLAKKSAGGYAYIAHAHNEVLPYEAYALHHGSQREDNLSPSQDLNHFDTIHAETALLLSHAAKNSSLFINVMPCPTCAKAVVYSGVKEVFYNHEHSEGYAVELFKEAGIKTQEVKV